MSNVERFFAEVDKKWKPAGAAGLQLHVLGSVALMLQADYVRGTKDTDVIETEQLAGVAGERLLALAGKDTRIHRRHGLYMDIVARGLPFLPQQPIWHSVATINASLQHLEIAALDVVDVVVSKLKRLNPNDVRDIEAMVEMDLVPPGILVDRFRSAVDWYLIDARASELPKYIRNLNRVERDLLGVGESEIELGATRGSRREGRVGFAGKVGRGERI